MRDLDVDLERRDDGAAIHLDLDVVGMDHDVLGDGGEDLAAQQPEQVALVALRALVREQHLQPLARDRRRPPRPKQIEQHHAALRPNSLVSRPVRSLGMVMGTSSPWSLRAASRYPRAGPLVASSSVISAPTLDARSTSWLSGMMPSSGTERISSTSSMFSISPRAARRV